MKKYLMTGIAALAMCAGFTSCSHDLSLPTQQDINELVAQKVTDNYNRAFIDKFGQPAENQDWGFGSASNARALTRSITVNGDVYDKFPSTSEVAANFPTSIPTDADEVADLESLYAGKTIQDQWGNTQTMYNLYHIYAYKIVEGYNLKITQAGTFELGGSYQNAGWNGSANVAYPYNVYVNVDGNVTIKRNGATHFNLYILKGNVTLDSNYGEQAGLISVAKGATLNDPRNSIAANQGIKLYNRGTVNATNTQKYDIGNFSTVYNEGKFNVSGALTYSPGDANTSFFVNLGDDAELTATAMTLNSSGNFFNSGKVTIAGETNVTQAGIYWVNDGYYTTGSMIFSAKNATFYNYCQLIIKGNAHMYDGEFNLMENSYTEAGTAEFDNFIVNMGSNTGMNIKGTVKFEAQGDGTYQGFRTNGSNDYLLIGGKVTVACHKKTFSVSSGITYSIKEIEIVRWGWQVVTEAQLQAESSGDYPVLDLNGTECPYGQLTVTPNTNSCGATWKKDTPDPEYDVRILGEDLTPGDTDWDFNDVVFGVKFNSAGNGATCTLIAAGGTLPLYIATSGNAKPYGEEGYNASDWVEVHDLFGVDTKVMVNTGGISTTVNKTPTFDVTNINSANTGKDIRIFVEKTSEGNRVWVELLANQGEPAAKLAVTKNFKVCTERQNINTVYTRFSDWVGNTDIQWY